MKTKASNLDHALDEYARATRDLCFIEQEIMREFKDAWLRAQSPNVTARKAEVELQLTELESERRQERADWEIARARWKTELVKMAALAADEALNESLSEVV